MSGGRNRAAAQARQLMAEAQAREEEQRKARIGEQMRLSQPMREYEQARMARGKLALQGKYNVSEDPQFQMIRQGLQKLQGQQLTDVEESGARTGLGGISAQYLTEKLQGAGASTILNTAAALEGEQAGMIEEGSQAGKNIQNTLTGIYAPETAGAIEGEQQRTAQRYAAHEAAYQRLHEKKMGAMQGGFSLGSSACCFIFYSGDRYLRAVHMFRDEFYPKGGFVDLGYRLMALWLVPLMLNYPMVKRFVIFVMLDPLAKYAVAHYSRQKWMKLALIPFKWFWPSVWAWYGRTALAWNKIALRLGV